MTSGSLSIENQDLRINDGISYGAAMFYCCLLGRLLINSSFLDLFISYSSAGGSIIEKIHPANYLIFLLSIYLLNVRSERSNPIIWIGNTLIALACIGIAWSVYTGNTTSVGFLVDNILFAGVACWGIASLRVSERKAGFFYLRWALFIHGLLLIFEFAANMRLLPFAQGAIERNFRPTGLLAHPLNNGLVYVTLLPMISFVGKSAGRQLLAMSYTFLIILCSGARAASVVGLFGFVFVVTALAFRKEKFTLTALLNSFWFLFMLPLAAIVLYAIISYFGLDYRLRIGLFDDSSDARVEIYGLLDYLSVNEFYFGAGNDALKRYALMALQARAVESPIVIAIFNFGAIYASLFFAVLLLIFGYMLRRGVYSFRVALISFTLIAMTNNVLMTKFPAILLILLLFDVSNLYRSNSPRKNRILRL